MMKYIILLLLFSSGLTAQTKWRQIERSSVKWRVPAAYDSIPGQTGYASKYIDFTTLMDTVGVTSFAIDSLDYRNDSLLIWVGGGYYFAIIPQGASGSGGNGEVAYWMQDTLAGDTVHFWDVSNKRLGLNTKTPAALLHVKKNEYALPVAQFENPGTNGQTVLIKHGASSDARYTLTLQTPAATTYFDARGYLGLGVSPSYPLHVYGSNGISRFENTGSNGDAGFDLKNVNKQWRVAMNAEGGSTNNLHFRDVTGSRYPLTLQSSNGYVGILNLTPARELHVTGRVRVSTLDSDLTPPTTAGPTKMVITDESGDLSFANIPSGGGIDSTIIIGGWGIESTESPANTFNLIADSTQVASQYDLTLKQDKLTNPVTGTGTTNYVSKFTGTSTIGDSQIQDNGSTVGIGGLDASYKFYQATGDAKIGGTTGYHRLFFGDAQTVYVGEWDLTNRLYLRGGSMALDIGGSRGTNGQVLTSNGASASWVTPSTSSGTVTSVQLAAGTGISLAGTNPITTSGTITVTNSSPNVTANLDYTNTTSPVTLRSSDGTDVTFTAGSGITLSATGSNMTITGSGANGTGTNTHVAFWTGSPATLTSSSGLIWDNSNTRLIIGAPTTPSRSLDVNGSVRFRSLIADVNNSTGNPGQYLTSNGVGAWFWSDNPIQTWGYLSTTSGTATAITTTATKINFASSESNGPITVSSVNDDMTVTNAGRYEFDVNLTMLGAADRNVTLDFYVGGVSQSRSVKQTKSANHFEQLSLSGQITLTASAVVDVRILYDNTTGSGTDINYERPRFSLKRLN